MNEAHRVPPADQPHEYREDYPEETRDTIWENPTEHDVVLDLHVGTTPYYGPPSARPKMRREQLTGCRMYVITRGIVDGKSVVGEIDPTTGKPRGRRTIPAEFDQAIQQTSCRHPDCVSRKMYCRNGSHEKDIVGGLGPYLKNRGVQVAPRLHPSLDALHAEKMAAEAKARQAIIEKAAAQDALQVAQGQVIMANEAREHQLRALAAREDAIASKERELLERADKAVQGGGKTKS
jgi:hypothetical protein